MDDLPAEQPDERGAPGFGGSRIGARPRRPRVSSAGAAARASVMPCASAVSAEWVAAVPTRAR